ncbi:MAG: cysteine--tRNA ligase [Chloroflexota bacterium]|nr:cysteine--tRNA ligase [Chloroflexota bacterium]MDE3192837.1 cysteine--tRNA ligase [Chloroflexota bacterium]
MLVIRRRRRAADSAEGRERRLGVGKSRHPREDTRRYAPAVLRLYDTRRRGIFPFRPRGREVTLYVCGVTPYDTTHLGHARTYLTFDVLVRLLEARGRTVRYAQNVTDIDESILQRAARDGVAWDALGKREERKFLEDMDRLGWRKPDVMPHATREIRYMHQLIRQLLERGAAYVVDGSVYFSVATEKRYGELSRLSPAKMRAILATQDDAALDERRRRDPLDFALWRSVPSGPTWPSPWGQGRPGWHIECSAMALHHLGDRIDIHGGGADLIYPHHEDEIAQSEACTGKCPVVGWWVHAGLVRLDMAKMSKSDGNMVFVRDALTRASPEALRFYLLDSPYRRPFDHEEPRLARAAARQATLAADLGRPTRSDAIGRDAATRRVLAALEDDLNVARAIGRLERSARSADERVRASLRAIARGVLGIV